MTFERPWVLLFAWLPVLWVFADWRRTTRRIPLALKGAAVMLVLAALSEPGIEIAETRSAVAVLVDTSASVPEADLRRASELATAIEKARGRHWVRVIPFARSTRPPAQEERPKEWQFRRTSGEAGEATDMEAALRQAIAALPPAMVPRVALISDGKENRGSIARAAWQAQQLGIPIDTFPLPGKPRPGLRLESLAMPTVAFTGDKFPIDLVVSSPRRAEGVVEISAEGKRLGSIPVQIAAGASALRVHANVSEPGAIELAIALRAEGLGEIVHAQAVTLRRPRLLHVSGDPPGTGTHFLATLAASRFETEEAGRLTGDAELDRYQIVVLNNQDLEALPPVLKSDLERYVKQGGGLLVVGGERNVYVDRKKKEEDPLERTLPARLAPPRSPEGTCVIIIVDKSSSMEGRKMELARLAAIGVIDNLRPVDQIGVLIFDNSFQWAVPIRRAEDRSLIKRLVAGITPDGGTQIAPALSEAYRRLIPVRATYKHIVLLTDGISEEGDSISLAKEAAVNKVTISTVGLGQDVNRAYLEKVASFSKGRSYFLTDPSGLEQILLRDVMEHTGSTAIEKPVTPVVARKTEILEGTGMESAPPLKGYVKFEAKPTAETILLAEKDPLLTRWQFGLGRASVFASDAKSRWAEQWVDWPGYDRFWANVLRDLLPHSQAGEASLDYDSANGELVVDYRFGAGVSEPEKIPDLFVFGPDGFRRPINVTKVAEGAYRGAVGVGHRQGLFRVRPLEESRAFPEVGLYRPVDELREYGNDAALLRQVSAFTGGLHNPEPARLFDTAGRSIPSSMRLWPLLVALALILNLAELVVRKWRGVLEGMRRA